MEASRFEGLSSRACRLEFRQPPQPRQAHDASMPDKHGRRQRQLHRSVNSSLRSCTVLGGADMVRRSLSLLAPAHRHFLVPSCSPTPAMQIVPQRWLVSRRPHCQAMAIHRPAREDDSPWAGSLPVSSPRVYPPAEAAFHFISRVGVPLHCTHTSIHCCPAAFPSQSSAPTPETTVACTAALRGPPQFQSIPSLSPLRSLLLPRAPPHPSECLRCPHSRAAAGLLLSLVTRPIRSAAGRLACGPSPLSASMFDARCYAFDARRDKGRRDAVPLPQR